MTAKNCPKLEGKKRGKPIFIAGEKFDECPVGLVTNETNFLLNIYSLCRKFKKLPCSGGVLEQPNKVLESLLIVSSVEDSILNKNLKKMEDGGKKTAAMNRKKAHVS